MQATSSLDGLTERRMQESLAAMRERNRRGSLQPVQAPISAVPANRIARADISDAERNVAQQDTGHAAYITARD